LAFFPPGAEIEASTVEAFLSFLYSFVLCWPDGTRIGLEVWVEEIEEYRDE